MKQRRLSATKVTSLLVASAMVSTQAGCFSTAEVVNTDRVYLLGPKTESVPGTATRDVSMKAMDTNGNIAFHLDRARECTVTSTPRFQRVHVEGKQGKRVAAAIISGSLLTVAGGGLIASSFFIEDGSWLDSSNTATGAGLVGIAGVIMGIVGLVILPRGIYHAAVTGTTVTPHDIEVGLPPPGAVRAPSGYDPKNPEVTAFVPFMQRPTYDFMAFGAQPAGQIQGFSKPLFPAPKPAKPLESLRSAHEFDQAVQGCALPSAPSNAVDTLDASRTSALDSKDAIAANGSLLAIPQSSESSDDAMKACVQKYTPTCSSKCGSDRACVLQCLRKPCVENLDKEVAASGGAEGDEYTQVLTRKEVCERSADAGVAIAVVFKDADGVVKTVELGKSDRNGDVKKNVLASLESTYPGWPDSKQAILQEAQIVLVEDPSVVLGKLDLAKYPALAYAEHVVSTKKQREALAAAEAARKEKEARDRQAALEAAAKAEDDRLHADERKAEAAKKAQACAAAHQSKCSSECQGNSACVKKCLQKQPACK